MMHATCFAPLPATELPGGRPRLAPFPALVSIRPGTMAGVPESVLKKRKRAEDWAAKRADASKAKQLKVKTQRKEVFKRAETYAKEYRQQVSRLIELRARPVLLDWQDATADPCHPASVPSFFHYVPSRTGYIQLAAEVASAGSLATAGRNAAAAHFPPVTKHHTAMQPRCCRLALYHMLMDQASAAVVSDGSASRQYSTCGERMSSWVHAATNSGIPMDSNARCIASFPHELIAPIGLMSVVFPVKIVSSIGHEAEPLGWVHMADQAHAGSFSNRRFLGRKVRHLTGLPRAPGLSCLLCF